MSLVTQTSRHIRAETALHESEQAIRVYTDNVPAMIAYVDREYRLQFINKAFERTACLERTSHRTTQ